MFELAAPDLSIARWLIERGLGAVYLVAFVVAARQFVPLAGSEGLTPATRVLRRTTFWQTPSMFHWRYSDRLLVAVSWLGAAIAALIVLGIPQQLPLPLTMLAWFVLWALYLSIVNVGGTWYGFGWESLLLEAGFLAIFLGNATVAPPWLVLLGFRWLAFRVEFGAGLIKLRGDRCWRDLTCMDYHHETQPMPNPLSWLAHRMPRWFHRIEAGGNFVAQLALPFGLFLPQPFATATALLMIATQLYLILTGNYAWLNWVTLIALVAAVGDGVVRAVLPLGPAPDHGAAPEWFALQVLAVALIIAVLSVRPVLNLISPNQAMNASFDPFHLVNTYGAFGSVSPERYELIIEGTDSPGPADAATWRGYEFPGKPGDPARIPPQVAPYHYRLGWLLWFVPLSPSYGESWLMPLLLRLLQGDRLVRRLIRVDPFPDAPPVQVRARLVLYRFATFAERRETGDWWVRRPVGDLVPPLRLRG
jgi:hypothetical protein